MKIKKFVVAGFLFLVLLMLIYIVHVRFFRVNVVFYAAIFDGVLAALLTFLFVLKIKYFSNYTVFEKIQIGIIFILLGYIFAISIPAVIDRSLSLYILEKIQQRGGGIKQNGFEEVFIKEYVVEHRLVDVRLTEQLQSGTIQIDNGCVKLTSKGKIVVALSRYFRKNFLPRKRLLMGEYSDDLTDPFGHGAVDESKSFDYICK